MEVTPKKLLTPKEVASILGVAQSTIYKWAWSGDLPCIFIQRRKRKAILRFKPNALDNWIRKKEVDSRRLVGYYATHATGEEGR